MREDIHFVFDEEWDEQINELKQIIHETGDPELHKNVFVVESLMRACALGFVKRREEKKEILGKEITKPKYYQKILNIPTEIEIQPVPVPSSDLQIQTVQEFVEVPKYRKKVIIEPEQNARKKDLIIDRITQKTLASASVDNNYTLNEPKLDDNDIKVLDKVKRKNPKNMEKGWSLIQKYGKKFNIQSGHDTLIKYYAVNDLFGLGRIEPLLHDQDIKKIICEGAGKSLSIELNNKKLGSNINFSLEDLKNFVYTMAAKFDRKINKKNKSAEGAVRGFNFLLDMGEDFNTPNFVVTRL